MQAELSQDGRTLTVSMPFTLKQYGGRKQVVTPRGAPEWAPARQRVDSTLVKALARAHRWHRMLESGEHGSIAELATSERINPSYIARVLRLTLLAPEIVEVILDRHHPPELTIARLFRPFPVEWSRQAHFFARG